MVHTVFDIDNIPIHVAVVTGVIQEVFLVFSSDALYNRLNMTKTEV